MKDPKTLEKLSAGAQEVVLSLSEGYLLGRTMDPDHAGRAWLEAPDDSHAGRQVVAAIASEVIESGLVELDQEHPSSDYVLWKLKK